MKRLSLTDDARDDLATIAEDIEDRAGGTGVGIEFVDKLFEHCEKMAGLPGTLGTARPEFAHDLRSTSFRGYLIFFRYQPGILQLVGVVHGSRRLASYFDRS